MKRALLSFLGFISVACGVVGFFIPVWPSTVFFIIALALFAKSNPKAEQWLLNHPKLGPGLRLWREQGAVSRPAKIAASATILVSIGASIYFVSALWVQVLLACIAVTLIAYICSRPEPRPEQPFAKSNDVA